MKQTIGRNESIKLDRDVVDLYNWKIGEVSLDKWVGTVDMISLMEFYPPCSLDDLQDAEIVGTVVSGVRFYPDDCSNSYYEGDVCLKQRCPVSIPRVSSMRLFFDMIICLRQNLGPISKSFYFEGVGKLKYVEKEK